MLKSLQLQSREVKEYILSPLLQDWGLHTGISMHVEQ